MTHAANYGTQSTIGSTLTIAHAGTTEGTFPTPQGYSVVLQTGCTDGGDGTYTLATEYVGTHVEFTPDAGTGGIVADSGGSTITANTTNQSAL